MQFSKSPRKTFETTNYHPGPGYYTNYQLENNKLNQQNKNKPQNNSSSFSKQEKIQKENYITPINYNNDTISYNLFKKLNEGEFKKKRQTYMHPKSASKEQILKVHAIPSIPSHQYKSGYQEIGDGLLILMKNNNNYEDQSHIGPGCYQANYDYVKKNTPIFSIKKESNNQQLKKQNSMSNSSFQVELVRQDAQVSNKDQFFESELSDYKFSKSKSQNQSRDQHGRYQQSSQTIEQVSEFVKNTHFNQQHKRDIFSQHLKKTNINKQKYIRMNQFFQKTGEENLELLVMRTKMMGKQSGPGPTTYFSQQNNSCINVQDKPVEFQCFNSNAPRFDEKLDLPSKLGPGAYQIQNSKLEQTNKGCIFLKTKKDPSFIQSNDIPGPGKYNVDQNNESQNQQDIIINNAKKKIKNRSASGEFPSAFGCSAQRFVKLEREETVPGPGAYQVKSSLKKAKKRRTRLVQITYDNNDEDKDGDEASYDNNMQSNQSNNNISNQIHQAPEKTNDILDDDYKNYVLQQYRQINSNKGTSSFSSRNPRFKDNQLSENIGPGKYQQQQQFIKQSFNVSNNLFNKCQQRLQYKSALPKSIGPGVYNAKFDIIKEKKVKDISFN